MGISNNIQDIILFFPDVLWVIIVFLYLFSLEFSHPVLNEQITSTSQSYWEREKMINSKEF
jgi:hypothetical protein